MKYLLYFLVFILCLVLQISILGYLPLFSISPNIFLVLVVLIGILSTQRETLIIAFLAGMWLDLASGGVPGIFAVIFMFVGSLVRWLFSQILLPSNAGKYLLGVMAISTILAVISFWTLTWILSFLHVSVITLPFGLVSRLLLWQTVYHLLLVYPLYFLLLAANKFSIKLSSRLRL